MVDSIVDIEPSSSELSDSELATLRRLLLGPEYQTLLKKAEILDNPQLLATIITPAIQAALGNKHPGNLQEILTPTVVNALMDSVSTDPKPIADALYPVMGPAIRQSISAMIDNMTRNFNQLLEQSVSPKAWRWRFDAWRTGRNYSEVVLIKNLVFQVEQVFLIHQKTGLLLQHVLAETAISKDPDMVSGMLTAIQDFTNDSFSAEQNSGLNSLKLGELTVLIEHGPHALLAAVVRGAVPSDLQALLSQTIEEVHRQEQKKLISYQGDTSDFTHLHALLSECLKTQLVDSQAAEPKKSPEKKKNKWLKPTAIGAAVLAALWLVYDYYQTQTDAQNWQALQTKLQSEPGVIITDTSYDNGRYHIRGLADPLATPPSSLINRGTPNDLEVVLAFEPYLSLDSDIILKRIHRKFDIPNSVTLNLIDETLILSGKSESAWIKQFLPKANEITGVKSTDTSKLLIIK